MVAQSTAKTTKSEKAIYFLPLISCSKKKLLSNVIDMLKFYGFQFYVEKKLFAPGNGGGAGAPRPLSLSLFWNLALAFSTALLLWR